VRYEGGSGSSATPEIWEHRAHVDDEGRTLHTDSPQQEDDFRRRRSSRLHGRSGRVYDPEEGRSDGDDPVFLRQRGGAGDDQKEDKLNTEERSIE